MLDHTSFLLKAGKPVAIAFFGGSITQGAGVADSSLCWRGLVLQALRKQYPAADIREIYAAIGGTGSDLGVFRAETDVLCHRPDLVFIEFAVNDLFMTEPSNRLRYEEALIRRILTHNPETDIVLVKTTCIHAFEASLRGEKEDSFENYDRLAAYYKLTLADLGSEITDRVLRGELTFEDVTVDGTHPNERGYALYAQKMLAVLAEAFHSTGQRPAMLLPPPLTDDVFLSARLKPVKMASGSFVPADKSICALPGLIEMHEAGQTLSFRFSGSAIGILYRITSDAGEMTYAIDEQPPVRLSTWDTYALRFDRTHYAILSSDLAPGEHELRITALGTADRRSQGTFIRIGAFLTLE